MAKKKKNLSLAVFAADVWDHVCPVVRLRGPAELADFEILQGTFWEDGQLRSLPDVISEADLVVVQRDFAKHTQEYEIVIEEARRQAKRVIYELDDLLCELPEEHPDHDHYLSARSTIIRSAIDADAIVTGSTGLKQYLQEFNPNVLVFPNALDDRLWKLTAPEPNNSDPVVIGYQGGHNHAYDLEVVTPVLMDLIERYKERIAFKFWGIAPPPPMRGLPNVEWLDIGLVRYAEFAAYFVQQKCDLFIAPLKDNPFNRCKSALKFLEYSALGAPGVYSRVTPYANAVRHGETGFLVSSMEEWDKALSSLIDDPALRLRLGTQAQTEVQVLRLLSQNAKNWAKIYRQLAQDRLEPKSILNVQKAAERISTWHQQLSSQFVTQKSLMEAASNAAEQTLEAQRSQVLVLNEQVQSLQTELAEINQIRQSLTEDVQTLKRAQSENAQTLELLQNQYDDQLSANLLLSSQNAEKDQRIGELDRSLQQLHQVYYEILTSRSWRLMRQFQRIRLKLIPKDGRLERMLKKGVQAPSYIRREGFRAFLQAGWRELQNPTPTPAVLVPKLTNLEPQTEYASQDDADSIPASLPIRITERSACQLPAIGVVVLIDPTPDQNGISQPELKAVQAWLALQTCAWVTCLCAWNRVAGIAWIVSNSHDVEDGEIDSARLRWSAENSESFLKGFPASYICFASDDLLAQEPTYLETNLIALETEALIFTVNLRGDAQWATRLINKGLLPGNSKQPALRQLIRRDCLGENLDIDLSTWLRKRNGAPGVVGKILFLITNQEDPPDSLPFDNRVISKSTAVPTNERAEYLKAPQSLLVGRNILARSRSDVSWNTISLGLFTLDAVLPYEPQPSEIPTIIIVMPFLAVGGAETIHYKIFRELKERLRIIVLTFEDFNRQLGTTADEFREITPYVYDLANFINPALNWSYMCYLIEHYQVDCLYIANGTSWIYDALGDLKRRYPTVRFVDQVYDHKVGWINRYDPVVALYTDGHIGVNAKILEAYVQKGAKPEQVFLAENGIDPEEINPAHYSAEKIQAIKAHFGIESSHKVVTFASRIHPQKRPMDFVEIARRFALSETFTGSIPIAFLLVGDGPLAETVDKQIEKANLNNIHRLSFYRPVSDIIAITDVLVLPSDFEGMPMIIIESQAMGKPVVVTDVGNNRNVLERTQGGVVISRIGDINQLVEGVKRMIQQPPDPKNLREITLEHFNIANVANRYYDILITPQSCSDAKSGE
jgi:glycosyltransferase involved in cell wall biosynthesis